MKILVLGNVGSGKTTLIQALAGLYAWEVVSIDEYRRLLGDGSVKAELNTRRIFIDAISLDKNQFIECTGSGEVSDAIIARLTGSTEQIICVILDVPKTTCVARLKKRNWDIPFPIPTEKVSSFIERIDAKIRSGVMEKEWNRRQNTLVLKRKHNDSNDTAMIIQEIGRIFEVYDRLLEHRADLC
jgi:adenylate kinase family enzyme